LRDRFREIVRDWKIRPIGSFIFLGQTGVGKTQLAKVLAKIIWFWRRIGSSWHEWVYGEICNLSFSGAPPGYVGYEGGQLTEKVRRKPYCVVLLDDRKAHMMF
jgi:ATP-dependent Clp protease ATP-binding subunit ClpC